MPLNEDASDEELIQQLAAGSHEAVGLLYHRYARLIFHLAARTLDRLTAEEIVQEVFLAVWRRAITFDPDRGPFRPWVLQQVWALHQGTWTSLGTAELDASGSARLIAEDRVLVVLPDAVQVTLEPSGGNQAPSGPVAVAWPNG